MTMAEVDKEKHTSSSSSPLDNEVLEVATTTDPEKGSDHKLLERKIIRKLDLRLLPLLCILYFLGYLDRSNIGNAKLGGLIEDLNLTTSQFQWCLSIFYFGYVLFDVPSNIILRRWRASYWLAILTGLWGMVAMAMAGVKNFPGLIISRLILGVLEAGFFPGVLYYLSIWYTRTEYGRRVSYFWSFSSLAGAFGGLIAYGISMIPTHTLNTWQWLFIIEGAPSVLAASIAAWYLPNTPETAKFLTDDERKFEIDRLSTDQGAANDMHGHGIELHPCSWITKPMSIVSSILREQALYKV